MRIAQIAPLFESVPPRRYGGTERVVHWLTEQLVTQGHEVHLFASGDSNTSARLIPCVRQAIWSEPAFRDHMPHHLLMMERVKSLARDFDLLHFHTDFLHFPVTRELACPSLTTMHGALNPHDHTALFEEFDDVALVSISDSQRKAAPHARWVKTVYHGMPLSLHTFSETGGDYFAFLGRVCREKGLDRAIRIACRAGVKLKIAARIYHDEHIYHREVIEPLIRRSDGLVEFVGEVGGREKDEFLRNARALLFPIDWQEPFGLVMIEALACGTPVIAWRNGSVPEIIEHGVDGFVIESEDEAVDAVKRVSALDRRTCRRRYEQRFDSAEMTRNYLEVYESLLSNERRNSMIRRSA